MQQEPQRQGKPRAEMRREALAEKIRAKTARVGVVGLGYVGLH